MIVIGAIVLLKPLVGIIRLFQYLAVSGTVSAVQVSVGVEENVIIWLISLILSIFLIIIGINGLRRKKAK